MPMPSEEIVKASAKLIQKLLNTSRLPAIVKHIARTNRISAKIYHKQPKKKSFKTPLEILLQLYNKIPQELRSLKPKTFKVKVKKIDLDFIPER